MPCMCIIAVCFPTRLKRPQGSSATYTPEPVNDTRREFKCAGGREAWVRVCIGRWRGKHRAKLPFCTLANMVKWAHHSTPHAHWATLGWGAGLVLSEA